MIVTGYFYSFEKDDKHHAVILLSMVDARRYEDVLLHFKKAFNRELFHYELLFEIKVTL